jgi:hypothetical protein
MSRPTAVYGVIATATLLTLVAVGCRDGRAVRVRLQTHAVPGLDAQRIAIRAQVTGPPDGLRYKWFSVNGRSDPQETEEPATVFAFADGVTRDRVSVEVWRQDKRVAYSQIDVQVDEELERAAAQATPKLTIAITTIPPYEAGGPDTRADIAGTVTGPVSPANRVVTYARADVWYIQPTPFALHVIATDGSWRSWTHTGTSYAAFVVRPGFEPLPRYDVLPPVGGGILARTIVDGAKH